MKPTHGTINDGELGAPEPLHSFLSMFGLEKLVRDEADSKDLRSLLVMLTTGGGSEKYVSHRGR